MKPSVIIAGIVVLLAVVIGGVVMTLGMGGGAAAYNDMTGEEIYGKLCMQCHGERGTALDGRANSYRGKRQYWNENSLLGYIAQPAKVKARTPHLRDSKKFMPALSPAVPMGARRKLVAHVIQLMDALEPDATDATQPGGGTENGADSQ